MTTLTCVSWWMLMAFRRELNRRLVVGNCESGQQLLSAGDYFLN
jgi:hypothetical protein